MVILFEFNKLSFLLFKYFSFKTFLKVTDRWILCLVVSCLLAFLKYLHFVAQNIPINIKNILLLYKFHPLIVNGELGEAVRELSGFLLNHVNLDGFALVFSFIDQYFWVKLIILIPPLLIPFFLISVVLHKLPLNIPLQLQKWRHVPIFIFLSQRCFIVPNYLRGIHFYIF